MYEGGNYKVKIKEPPDDKIKKKIKRRFIS